MLNIAEIAAQAAADVATDFIQDAGIVSSRDKIRILKHWLMKR